MLVAFQKDELVLFKEGTGICVKEVQRMSACAFIIDFLNLMREYAEPICRQCLRTEDGTLEKMLTCHPLNLLSSYITISLNQLQNVFGDIDSLIPIIDGELTKKYILTTTDGDEEKPIQYTVSFAYIEENKDLVEVYRINNIHELMTLVFYQVVIKEKKVVDHCKECGKFFYKGRPDKRFCSKNCKSQNDNKKQRDNPYHIKYRSLQKTYNRKTNEDLGTLGPVYLKWSEWASDEYQKMKNEYLRNEERLIEEVFENKPIKTLEDEMQFQQRLKDKWIEMGGY